MSKKKTSEWNIVQPATFAMEDLANGVKEWQAAPEKEIEQRRREIASGTMAMLAKIILDTPGLNSIVIRGYTPAWNDGETCYHNQEDVYLNGVNYYSCEQNSFPEIGLGEEESSWDDNNVFAALSTSLGKMEDLLAGIFGTNWAVLIKRLDDGTVGWKKISYDCGY